MMNESGVPLPSSQLGEIPYPHAASARPFGVFPYQFSRGSFILLPGLEKGCAIDGRLGAVVSKDSGGAGGWDFAQKCVQSGTHGLVSGNLQATTRSLTRSRFVRGDPADATRRLPGSLR